MVVRQEINIMEYKFYGKLTLDEYIQLQKFKLKYFELKGTIILLFIPVLLFLCDVIFLKNKGSIFIVLLFIVLIMVLIILVNASIIDYVYYKKAFKNNKYANQKCIFTVNKINIMIETEEYKTVLNKKKIYIIAFDKDSIYIFLDRNKARIIKRRYLVNNEEYNNLVLFIKENYKDNIN